MSFCELIFDSVDASTDPFAVALELARKGLGFTRPNPPVGCVVTKNGQIIATGHHMKAGGLHAEAQALEAAGEHAQGATLYVTLEPCNHFGRTPPCTQKIIQSGIRKVIYGVIDPNPQVQGEGIKALKNAGIEVTQVADTILRQRAEALILPFKTWIEKKRPYVIAKIATSLDGKIAFKTGEQTWITGTQTKALTHKLREVIDIIGVGSNTALVDKPALTARFNERAAHRQPDTITFRSKDGLTDTLEDLGSKGYTSLLLEGGGIMLTAFLKAGLVDEIAWFTAPKILGNQGVPAIQELSALYDYSKESFLRQVGVDFLTIVCKKSTHG